MTMSSEQAKRSEGARPGDAAAQATRNYKNIIGGLAAIAIAIFFIVPSFEYGLGSPNRMGAGFFPFALGVILAVIGVLILLPGMRGATGALPRISWRPAVAVLASIAVFAFFIERFGMIPAVCLAVAIAAAGNRGAKARRVAVLTIVVSIMTWLIFVYGLAIPLPVIRMP